MLELELPKNATNGWLKQLESLSQSLFPHNEVVGPRGLTTFELLNQTSKVNMEYPIVNCSARELSYTFMAAEAYWILTGRRDVAFLKKFAPSMGKYSNDGYQLDGAYGPAIMEQMRYVIEALAADPYSRQAVITIWRQNPRPSADIPCTISLQFIIRRGKAAPFSLNTIANMRSSDIWLGWPYDVFSFSMISRYVQLRLLELAHHKEARLEHWGPMHKSLELGYLYLNMGSSHLYEKNLAKAKEIETTHYFIKKYEIPFSSLGFSNSPNQLLSTLKLAIDDPSILTNLHCRVCD